MPGSFNQFILGYCYSKELVIPFSIPTTLNDETLLHKAIGKKLNSWCVKGDQESWVQQSWQEILAGKRLCTMIANLSF